MTSLPNDMIHEIMFHTTSLNDLQRLSQINQYANALYHNYFSWVEKRRKEFLFNDVLPTDLNDIKILYQKLSDNYQLALRFKEKEVYIDMVTPLSKLKVIFNRGYRRLVKKLKHVKNYKLDVIMMIQTPQGYWISIQYKKPGHQHDIIDIHITRHEYLCIIAKAIYYLKDDDYIIYKGRSFNTVQEGNRILDQLEESV